MQVCAASVLRGCGLAMIMISSLVPGRGRDADLERGGRARLQGGGGRGGRGAAALRRGRAAEHEYVPAARGARRGGRERLVLVVAVQLQAARVLGQRVHLQRVLL